MKDILSEIVENKRRELAASVIFSGRSLKKALTESGSGIIAEFKRKSPSRGWIHEDADPMVVIPAYEKAGAAALSILTDGKYFGGDIAFIKKVRPLVNIPILRKDFIISRQQILEARIAGADAVLLIAACLTLDECGGLTTYAHDLGLEVLLEIHSADEIEYVTDEVDVVGVNNRNLGTFVTDVENSFALAELLSHKGKVMVSESGISSPDIVYRLRNVGYRGFLMGENFMKHENPAKALSDFIGAL